MKKILTFACSLALLLLGAVPLQAASAFKDTTLSGNTTITGNVTSNATITNNGTNTFGSSSNATFSGAFNGTPTGGTLNLGNVTLTLGAFTLGGNITGNITTNGTITAQGISHTFGSGGTGTDNALITINGSSATSYGAYTVLQRNSVSKWSIGTHSGIQGGASDDYLIYNQTAGNESFRIAAATGNVGLAGSVTANGAGSTFKGTATNDNAATGYVGEYVSSTVAAGSAITLTSGIAADITSITLTAGDWDVEGVVIFSANVATTVNYALGGISGTSATLADPSIGGGNHNGGTFGSYERVVLPTTRFSTTGSATIYLPALADFAVNSMSAFGTIRARRVR